MSKVVISADTETKMCSVSIDGEEVPNVNYACVSKHEKDEHDYGPEFSVMVTSKEKVGDLMKHSTMMASASTDLPQYTQPHPKFSTFRVVNNIAKNLEKLFR